MSTPLDRFREAALTLARSGSIKERLTDAYRNHLALVEESELPLEVIEEFRAVSYALNRELPVLRDEDTLRATVRKMSNMEADRIASVVVRLFGELARDEASGTTRKGPKSAPQIVSLYPGEAWNAVNKVG